MISDQGESPGEILTATAHFKVISLFCLHRTSDKIHTWNNNQCLIHEIGLKNNKYSRH